MRNGLPSRLTMIAMPTGRPSPHFYSFWENVRDILLGRPDSIMQLPSYTVATLPSAASFPRGLIYVSDGTGDKRLAVSDGTDWRFPDGAIVS